MTLASTKNWDNLDCVQSDWFFSTSAVNFVFQVLGNAKGAVAVVVSIMLFRNPVSVTGMLGYTLTVCGVILYSEAKRRSNNLLIGWGHCW
jgi:hypothetical protein